jgi:hypothetical protein
LILEGTDDIAAFENFLTKVHPDWENTWVLAGAGKKIEVLAILEQEANWMGVVDRDEWSADKIETYQTEFSNLWVLPRYCIENYLIVPAELWLAIPGKQQTKIAGGLQILDQAIKADLERWRCHGVLWSVINPLWEGLRGMGFKEALLDPAIATNADEIRHKLAEWHDYLEPDQIWQQYQQALAQATQLNADEQLKYYIHGKHFFAQIVTPVLNQLLIQESADQRQQKIFRTLPLPADLDPLWQKMGLKP